jgi:hypothetical protein
MEGAPLPLALPGTFTHSHSHSPSHMALQIPTYTPPLPPILFHPQSPNLHCSFHLFPRPTPPTTTPTPHPQLMKLLHSHVRPRHLQPQPLPRVSHPALCCGPQHGGPHAAVKGGRGVQALCAKTARVQVLVSGLRGVGGGGVRALGREGVVCGRKERKGSLGSARLGSRPVLPAPPVADYCPATPQPPPHFLPTHP